MSARRFLSDSIVFLVIVANVRSAEALTLLRGPYIGRPNDEHVTVIWQTDNAADGSVEYFTENRPAVQVSDGTVASEHRIRLTDLQHGQQYRYVIRSAGNVLAEGTFVAPRSREQVRFMFGVIGDTENVPAVLPASLAAARPDFVLHTGDVVYPAGAMKDYDSQFFRPFAPVIRNAPMLPTLGNHDVMSGNGEPLLSNFVLPKNDAGTSRYYALRQGNALFICLDLQTTPYGYGSKQYRWLEAQLQSPGATWIFVWFHDAVYSSATPNNVARLILAPLFEYYGVDVVFSGHQHLYERTNQIRDFTALGKGVVYMTVGGGGSGLTSYLREDYSAYVEAAFSYVTVSIEDERSTFTAHRPDGTVFDTMVLVKGPVAGPSIRRRSVRSAP